MNEIGCIVLDFDGTLTHFTHEAPEFEARYRENLAACTSPRVHEHWATAAASVDADPERHAVLVPGDHVTAAGDADPYLRCFAISQELNRRLELFPDLYQLTPIAGLCYAQAYAAVSETLWSTAMFRPETPEFLRHLRSLGVPVWLVSNADLDGVERRLSILPAELHEWLGKLGNAQKFAVRPPSMASAAFDALPQYHRIEGVPRPVELKRGFYYEALCRVWEASGASAENTLVIGDVFDFDLALPIALGAHVHWVQKPAGREPYRAALRALPSGRGSYGETLTAAFEAREFGARGS